MTQRTVIILQPGYLPWLGFFEQLHRSDVFVVYDDAQYDKHGWRNRNRIKTAQGWQWITVPVLTRGQDKPSNKEVLIDNSLNWRVKHGMSIRQNYAKASYFDAYFAVFDAIYSREWKYLIDLDMEFVYRIAECVGITSDFQFASTLNISGGKTERLALICEHFGASAFYEGHAGQNYIEPSYFEERNIQLIYQNYQHPVYRQLYGAFIPYMSMIDLLFNHGPDSLDILAGMKQVQVDVA